MRAGTQASDRDRDPDPYPDQNGVAVHKRNSSSVSRTGSTYPDRNPENFVPCKRGISWIIKELHVCNTDYIIAGTLITRYKNDKIKVSDILVIYRANNFYLPSYLMASNKNIQQELLPNTPYVHCATKYIKHYKYHSLAFNSNM